MIDLFGRVVLIVTAIILILGGYQVYFWPQKNKNVSKRAILFKVREIDKFIPFKPGWIWVYSGLYYPIIIYLVLIVSSFEQFVFTAFSFISLLFFQFLFFYLFPVKTPESWRLKIKDGDGLTLRFLKCVQGQDGPENCFPSMHCSVAMLTAMHLISMSALGDWSIVAFLFPLLIGISTLFTKQHYFVDVPAGFLLGWVNFKLYTLYAPILAISESLVPPI